MLAYYIMLEMNESLAPKAMIYAMHHDAAEAVTGDIPYLVREQLKMARIDIEAKEELGIEEPLVNTAIREVVKFADAFELKLYLEEERRSGNNSLYEIECETYHRLFKYDVPNKVGWLQMLDPMPESNFKGLLHE
jgi:5'-deoxynucleotidase YfbR-like HD superfamily hydrolase